MKLRELKQKLQEIPDEYLDVEVLVDTDGAEFSCHMVDITGCYYEGIDDIGMDMVYLTLDDGCKTFRTNN